MSRFRNTSKFKNAFVNVHKKEAWIHDLNVGTNLSGSGDQIKASCSCIAFIHDSNSVGSVAILPLNATGRFSEFPLIAGHSRPVTDFTFSPFYDFKLASGSEDGLVKIWDIPTDDILTGGCRITEPSLSLEPTDGKVGCVLFHPCADNILAVSSETSVMIYDLNNQKRCFDLNEHSSVVECVSWGNNGQLLASISKDGNKKLLQLFDPRSSLSASAKVNYHSGQKHSKVLFMDDTDCLVTAGLGVTREVEIALWDTKKMSAPVARHSLGSSSGNPTLMYDADTKLLFSAVKSESTVTYYDASVSLTPCPEVYRGALQTKGITMVPKRALHVLSCEVTRLLQLTQNAIIPISYHVQRKSHSEFHSDLFPPTKGGVAALSAEEWVKGENKEVERVSLDPSKQKLQQSRHKDSHEKVFSEEKCGVKPSSNIKTQSTVSSAKTSGADTVSQTIIEKETNVTKPLNIVRSSKFRHIEGSSKDKATYISKFPSLSSTVPGDSNAFQANSTRVAVVFSSPGGQIGVFELNKPGRLDKGTVPTLQNGSAIMDFAFDPFDCSQLLVACEDAKLRLWTIPNDGLVETLTDPQELIGHEEKANVLQFHPQAKSVFVSSGYDCQLLLWTIPSGVVHVIDRLSAPLFCLCWSLDGSRLATFSKDQFLSVYNPRTVGPPLTQGKLNLGSRGARLVWLEDTVIALSGFNKTSVRTVTLYNTSNLDSAITEISTNISPATLIPYYDRDTKLLFLTGKGDSVILAYEYVSNDPPYLHPVSPFKCASAHQSVAFLPKTACDVAKVEIASGLRLTTSTVEGFAVHVPRTRTTFFQDDLYPDTLCVEESCLSSEQWLSGSNAIQRVCSLQPPNMKKLSEAPKEPAAAKKFVSYNPKYKTDQQKKEELLSAMIDRMGEKEDDPLPQQDMDGADSDEWSD